MLTPPDIISGKLLVQLGYLSPQAVQAAMLATDGDPDLSLDLVARLANADQLEPLQVKRVRRYQAMFDHIRREAVTLRQVERHKPQLSKQEIGDLIARIERDRYRRRLLAVLVDAGKLSLGEAQEIEQRTRDRLLREDVKVLTRYRQEGFSGVGRPLVPASVVDTGIFKVSALFRSPDTLKYVKKAIARLDLLEAEAATEKTSELEFVAQEFVPDNFDIQVQAPAPGGEATEELELDPADLQLGEAHMDTARFRAKPGPEAEAEGLGSRESIGEYEVVEVLGQGGMGAVYLAQEHGMGPMVAVKVTLAGKAAADDLARFEREAAICAQLKHPNVVHLIEEGTTDDGLRFMVIPFFVGKDLKAVLDEKGPLELPFAFELFEQMLAGLEAVHQQGVVHRDLKPENVFVLSGNSEVKIVDFGIARKLDHQAPAAERLFESKAGVVSGSPHYIAPETVTGSRIDARTDIYSLGIMFFYMVTGRMPLFAESAYDCLREHLVGVPLTLFQGKKDVHWCDGLERLVARMLAKEPDDRPASCQEILDLLEGGLRDQAIAERQDPPVEEEPEKGLFNSFFKMFKS